MGYLATYAQPLKLQVATTGRDNNVRFTSKIKMKYKIK